MHFILEDLHIEDNGRPNDLDPSTSWSPPLQASSPIGTTELCTLQQDIPRASSLSFNSWRIIPSWLFDSCCQFSTHPRVTANTHARTHTSRPFVSSSFLCTLPSCLSRRVPLIWSPAAWGLHYRSVALCSCQPYSERTWPQTICRLCSSVGDKGNEWLRW